MPRLFVALRPPLPVRGALAETYGGVEGARWQDDEQLHLTLRFIGEIDRYTAEDLAAALASVSAAPFALQIRGSGHFERRGKPAALWAALAPAAPLVRLHAQIERACRSAGIAPEPRKFVPHVTLARLGGRATGAGEWLSRHGDLRAPEWPVGAFALYESTLHPGGSRYTAVADWPLQGRE